MKDFQEEFLRELKTTSKLAEYAALYNKYMSLAVEHENKKGSTEIQNLAMSHYYIDSVLSEYLANEELVSEIIGLAEPR